jgi:hypothetical protein
MIPTDYPYAFRILGPLDGPRKRVDAEAAFAAYCRCDERARVDTEAYLSHFRFDESFRDHLATTGSTRDFNGNTWAEELVFDIDAEGDLPAALEQARKLTATLTDTYEVPRKGFTSHFSGSKGFHIALPTRLWLADGGPNFHRVAGVFARRVAAAARVTIDVGVYDRVRALRAPNSVHPKTGLHKRHIPADVFETITVDQIVELARSPAPFERVNCNYMPIVDGLAWEWKHATEIMAEREAAAEQQRAKLAAGLVKPTLNRLTLEIIRGEPVEPGDRHRLIYSAARDLAEKGAPRHLVDALLREVSLDTGLPPREVDRQLDCGFNDAIKAMPATRPPAGRADGSTDHQAAGPDLEETAR